MLSGRHITKLTAVLIIAVILLCAAGITLSHKKSGSGGSSVEYETKLFDTDKVIDIDILMDAEKWQSMLDNAMSEKYVQCDVSVNGTRFYGVGVRPKGNTSLSSIARDPDNNRYSFKIEFDQFADGQTCFGLDKLVLNNSYADNSYMKEALIYDMYRFMDADAPLYNYAKVSVNGEYWGVYLALEAVEDSFMLRNYGTEKGYLYKPDGMNMGGRDGAARPQGGKWQNMGGGFPPEGFGGKMPGFNSMKQQTKADAPQNEMHNSPEHEAGQQNAENNSQPPIQEGNTDEKQNFRPNMGGFQQGGFGGFGGRGGANLNYIDDKLSSYSTIWNGAISGSSDADHRRIVTALKNIGEGTSLEEYMDIDNVIKYMAVHSFSVNDDSLSGHMAHNYYLYESGGRLNILPWDYNLALGGMHRGDAKNMVNDPIDTPFEGTQFFDKLLENEEYKARYHECYNKLIEEYIYGGKFEEIFVRICNQIDTLVKDDPNTMCTYEEYKTAVPMLKKLFLLRAESVRGQLSGNIPSTQEAQSADSAALIDASEIDTSVMGRFMGGGPREKQPQNENKTENSAETTENKAKNGVSPNQNNNDFRPPQNGGGMPFGRMSQTKVSAESLVWGGISLGILLAAFIFVKLYGKQR